MNHSNSTILFANGFKVVGTKYPILNTYVVNLILIKEQMEKIKIVQL